ncbi:hypothetical protein TGVEG_365780 [Toxoplasma gondii VEG]|uniref:Uncharacterized protein n=1 Tax=Toxoplasma gondii (strain ATCC 50861 / VEG) TaxID=432359 RepID=V4ZIB9_TOXGV|nr:hypothetical protein TGVEG_365780 [Toxoplasma gondii VEG]
MCRRSLYRELHAAGKKEFLSLRRKNPIWAHFASLEQIFSSTLRKFLPQFRRLLITVRFVLASVSVRARLCCVLFSRVSVFPRFACASRFVFVELFALPQVRKRQSISRPRAVRTPQCPSCLQRCMQLLSQIERAERKRELSPQTGCERRRRRWTQGQSSLRLLPSR